MWSTLVKTCTVLFSPSPAKSGSSRKAGRAVTARLALLVLIGVTGSHLVSAGPTLVADGQGQAVIVTADNPSPIARLAAEELLEHVRLATGAELESRPESALPESAAGTRIFIGRTRAAATLGLDPEQLEADGFYLRTDGADLYIIGRENDHDYDRNSGRNGTLYGTYELIERALGIRWLWPGRTGTYVPHHHTVTLPALDETARMMLPRRHFRTWSISGQVREYQPHIERLAFTPEGLADYHHELMVYLRRHRVGNSKPLPLVPHQNLHRSQGTRNPDWFAMNRDGDRTGPTFCVSNPDLQRFVVTGHRSVTQPDNIMLGEADVRTYCHCPDCLAWDEPQPPDWPHHITSNRYARFAAAVRDHARRMEPDRDLMPTMFIYMDYMHAPTIDIDLTGIHAAFCPWFSGFNPWYPMSEESHQLIMDTWRGWHQTGISLHYRPNYLIGGYVMPHLSTRQSGEMFRFAARHGNTGIDYSLYGQWAVKGPMIYMLMRLAGDPDREVAALRDEYFQGFGPAAPKVEAYFDYWEDYAWPRASGAGGMYGNPARAHELYPPESFSPAFRLLAAARELAAADEDPIYSERIAFLEAGLEHARLAAAFTATLRFGGRAPTDSRESFTAAQEALQRLIAFRRDHEHLFITDYTTAAWAENRSLEIDSLLEGEFRPGEDSSIETMLQPWGSWFYRRDPDDQGVTENWFTADPVRSAKGLRVYDDDGRRYEIDREIWTPVRVPARLAETAVGDYLGFGWYVTVFRIPETWNDVDLRLHFRAVDEQAWIYVNGEYLGEHTIESEGVPIGRLWDAPFAIKAPAGLITSEHENLLVVRTHASAGASGIWGPVGIETAE